MIMKVAGIQFHPWGEIYHFDPKDFDLKAGDKVIVKTDLGLELGTVINLLELDRQASAEPLKIVLRPANSDDLRKLEENSKKKNEVLEKCRALIGKYNLPMKLVDCDFAFDGGKITIAFTAEERVDFRELVKDLTRTFQKSIRLEQIGIRDEARRVGDLGPCGRSLCCQRFLKDIGKVTTDLARVQQISHRGSDRLSGFCGRLMCCLAFERSFYEEESKKFPAPESIVKTRQGEGKVLSFNILKKTVNVELGDRNISEIPLDQIKF